ncbi:cingulin-like [Cucumis melo var. makuwa]|uniref:Cingulin-like n=1 Tax=Cucumis melo var. makuwa TaxID=1194695 RepID=A0A5D3D3N7_CUCMM|nr:cingulin-like [Cucumis melo var. makuwa]
METKIIGDNNSLSVPENYNLFISLINEYVAEKMRDEQRIVILKRRIEDLRSQLEATNVEIENAKRARETTQQELKGCEVELSMNKASVQTLEIRISVLQSEIATTASELESLKIINHLFALNKKIRAVQSDTLNPNTIVMIIVDPMKFQEELYMKNVGFLKNATEESHQPEEDNNKNSSLSVEERLIRVITEITHGEEDCMTEEQILREDRETKIYLEQRRAAMLMMVKGQTELEAAVKYP